MSDEFLIDDVLRDPQQEAARLAPRRAADIIEVLNQQDTDTAGAVLRFLPEEKLIEIFDQLGPLPPGFGTDGPIGRDTLADGKDADGGAGAYTGGAGGDAGPYTGGADGAASRLGLKRTTLNSKLKKLGVQRGDYISPL